MLTPELTKRFPDARFHPDWRLVTWYPTGELDDLKADEVAEFLELAETVEAEAFNRYTDMSGFSRIQLGLDHVVRLARRRRRYNGPPVKSAFDAERLISLTIARLFAELMEGSRIQVCIFQKKDIAAQWLGVPKGVLQPPPDKAT
jgi:hypothetical protein